MRPPSWIVLTAAFVAATAAACSHDTTPPAPQGPGLGGVMVDVARRFELSGRAALAGRFELAEFEVGEIQESFEDDVPRAQLPKEGPTAHIPSVAKAFAATNLPELKNAAHSKDGKAFTDAFARAADACNGCHLASEKAFIQVPRAPGKPVPNLDPVGAAPEAASGSGSGSASASVSGAASAPPPATVKPAATATPRPTTTATPPRPSASPFSPQF
jgi:hypothetical protein